MISQAIQWQQEVSTAAKPKLLDSVRAAARVRHMALSTEKAYVHWIRRFILFHNKRHPSEMGKQEVSDFLTHLAVDGKVASSTQNQALAALLFLYRVVLEREFGWLEDVARAKRPLRIRPGKGTLLVLQAGGGSWVDGQDKLLVAVAQIIRDV